MENGKSDNRLKYEANCHRNRYNIFAPAGVGEAILTTLTAVYPKELPYTNITGGFSAALMITAAIEVIRSQKKIKQIKNKTSDFTERSHFFPRRKLYRSV